MLQFSFSEYPYKFVKVLKSQQLVEKESATLLCELNDASGEVKWFKGEEEITSDKRFVSHDMLEFFSVLMNV